MAGDNDRDEKKKNRKGIIHFMKWLIHSQRWSPCDLFTMSQQIPLLNAVVLGDTRSNSTYEWSYDGGGDSGNADAGAVFSGTRPSSVESASLTAESRFQWLSYSCLSPGVLIITKRTEEQKRKQQGGTAHPC